ncbi:MAG: DUF2834 domain-containing protein [Deltaproteobacteria bacterium]|jgi:hypothetical protein|nr:DUF2834 domain-containing protein [Deltaproteobacteria bacterium]
MGYFFLGLAFLGAVAPYAFLGQLIATGKFNLHDVRLEALANPVSSYLAAVVLVTMLATWVFIVMEGRRLRMSGLWLPFLATLLIGVSCGLPLFLFMRKISMDKREALYDPPPEDVAPPPPPPAAHGRLKR